MSDGESLDGKERSLEAKPVPEQHDPLRDYAKEMIPDDDLDVITGNTLLNASAILHVREKLKTTTLHLLSIPRDATLEHPVMREILALYEQNLVPDKAFACMVSGDPRGYSEAISRGGMLNRSQPTEDEMRKYQVLYKNHYTSVAQQMLDDMTGRSRRPGRFQIRGLRAADGTLAATLSYRLFPLDPAGAARYKHYLEGIFDEECLFTFTTPSVVQYRDVERAFPRMMEIDTINSSANYPKAGTKILADTLQAIRDEASNSKRPLPAWVYLYHFGSIRLKYPRTSRYDERYTEMRQQSNPSGKVFKACGFNTFGHKEDPQDDVFREISGVGVCRLGPKWQYRWARFATAQIKSQQQLRQVLGE